MVVCDKIIEQTKTAATNFNDKKVIYKTFLKKKLLNFLLITKAFLIGTHIYYQLITYQAKQKYLLTYYDTSKLKEIDIKDILQK